MVGDLNAEADGLEELCHGEKRIKCFALKNYILFFDWLDVEMGSSEKRWLKESE